MTQNELQKAIIKALAQAPHQAIKQLQQQHPEHAEQIKRIATAVGVPTEAHK